jgi:hypothetical protein
MKSMKAIWIVAILIISSCANINQRLVLEQKGVIVSCKLHRMQVEKVDDENRNMYNIMTDKQTWIHGKIKINNNSDTSAMVDLEDYRLISSSTVSSNLYYDTFVDRLMKPRPIAPQGVIVESVYWVFDRPLQKNEIEHLKLVSLK